MSDECRIIKIDPGQQRSRIDANIFGLHVEHLWNSVYPCIWVGSDSPIPNIDGIRRDTAELLAALRPPVCKYPGGYFTDFYDWRDGVGPCTARPQRVYPCEPGRVETNQFGTAEFVTFCRQIGAEPYLSVNTTSITPADASHWVEYCNSPAGTYWADKRCEHGYTEPFNVRYWAIGNEPYWLHSAEAYAERYHLWSHWMYNTDPTIVIVAGGLESGASMKPPFNTDGKWNERFAALTHAASGLFQVPWHQDPQNREILYSVHPYFQANLDGNSEEYLETVAELRTRLPRIIADAVAVLDNTRGAFPCPKLCFDEYGVIRRGFRMDGSMTQPAPFWAALWLAEFFHICFDHADAIGMANLPGTINMEHELLLLEGQTVVATPSYHVFSMLRDFGTADAVGCSVSGIPVTPSLKGPALSARAALTADGRELLLSVINLDLANDARAQIDLAGLAVREITGHTLTCNDIHACNSAADPTHMTPTISALAAPNNLIEHVFPQHSITVFRAAIGS